MTTAERKRTMSHDGTRRDYELPPAAPFKNEGKTIAGWVMFWGICIGGVVTGLGLVMWERWVLIVGVALLVLTVIVSAVLSAVGLGQPRNRDNPPGPGEPDWYA